MRIFGKGRRCLAILVAIVLGAMATLPAVAESVDITIGVGDTSIVIKGSTSPNALVTYMDGNSVIGSSAANAGGSYSQQFPNQTPGIHTYRVFAQDVGGRLTDTISVVVNVTEHAETEIDIFLPPTLTMADNEVNRGEGLGLTGSAFPNATVVIYVDGTAESVATDASGNWSYVIPTGGLSGGTHEVYVQAIKSGGSQSHPSQSRTFTVIVQSEQPGKTEPGQPTSPPQPGAKQPAPPVITSPKPGEVINGTSTKARGTAQPGTQIEVWNRGKVVGSTFADANGNWELEIPLTEFANRIKARACLGEVCSGFSETIQFFRQLSGEQKGLSLELERYRLRSREDDLVEVVAHIRGGDPAYILKIDWGDGRNDSLSTNNVKVPVGHRYQKAGKYKGNVTVTDEQHQSAKVEFSVDVSPRPRVFNWWRFLLWFAPTLLVGSLGLALVKRWYWTSKEK